MVPGHLQKPIKEHTNAQPSCCCKLLDVHCKTPHASSQLEKQKLANPAVESPAPACLACTCCCGQRWSQGRSCLPCLYCAASLAFLLLCLAAALRIAARALAPARQRPKAGRLPPSLQTLSAGLLQREQEPGVTASRRCSLQLACGAVRGGRTSRPARLETAPAAAAGWCVHFLQERTEKGQKGKRKSSSKTTLIDSNQEPRRAQESRASVPFESQYKSSKIHGKFLNLGEKREGERKTERGRKGGDPGGRRAPLFLLSKSPSK